VRDNNQINLLTKLLVNIKVATNKTINLEAKMKKRTLKGSLLIAHFEPSHIQRVIDDLEACGLKITKTNSFDNTLKESQNGYDLIVTSSLMFGFKKSHKSIKFNGLKIKEEEGKIMSELVPHLKESGKKIIIIAHHPIQASDIITDSQCLAAIQAADLYSDPSLLTQKVKLFFKNKKANHENHKNSNSRSHNSHSNRATPKKSS